MRPVRTRFPYGSASRLSLAAESNSLAHYAKGTPSPRLKTGLRPLVGTRFQVLFHSPTRGSFHLSLTVLCAIGRQRVLSLGGWSPLIPAGFLVSHGTWDRTPGRGLSFAYGAFTLYGWPFQNHSATQAFCNSPRSPQPPPGTSRYPEWATPAGFNTHPVWADPLSLAATQGVSVDFLSSPY